MTTGCQRLLALGLLMADGTINAVRLAQAEERLRQQRLMADEKIARARAFRRLQIAAGWTAVLMLPSIATVCVIIIIEYQKVPNQLLTGASAALFVDVLGLLVAAYRSMIVQKVPDEPLSPVTEAPLFDDLG